MNSKFKFGAELPGSIGICADLLKEVQAVRLAMEKEAAEVKKRETEIKEYIIANLSKSDDTGAAGKKYRAQIKTKRKPRVEDWPSFHEFIRVNNRMDLLQKRIADKAVMEMHENGELPPGLDTMLVPEISITKI